MAINSEVEIANMALDLIKEAPINSFNDDRAASKWMDRNYDIYRDIVLVAHPWKFATARKLLPEDTTKPDFEWTSRYKKPTDCLRVMPLRYEGRINGRLIPHEVEGEYILCNLAGGIKTRYIRRVTNVSEYDTAPLFIAALSAKLAASLAFWMTGREKMVDFAQAQFKEIMVQAQWIDSAEGSHAEQYANAYDDVRYGSTDRRGYLD